MIGQTSAVTTVPLYRYWNPGNGDHFYTTNWSELGSGRNGWGYEGVQCHVVPQQRVGSVPLYRYWNPGIGDHFYTTNWSELGSGRYGWGYEGVQCYVYPAQIAGTVPLYRYWNPGIGDHFYTTNWSELSSGRYGWGYEGVQCYVFTQPASPPAAEGGPSAETESSTGETMTGLQTPGSIPDGSFASLSAIPPTFTIGVSDMPPLADDSSDSVQSFITLSPAGEGEAGPRPASFTLSSEAQSGKRRTRSGQITITVNLGDSDAG
jgi:hypothetical protein